MSRLLPLGLFLVLGLAACGKRGPLEPPPAANAATTSEKSGSGAKSVAAQGPGAKSGGAQDDGEDTAPDSQGRNRMGGKKRVPITIPKRDLFIDSILE